MKCLIECIINNVEIETLESVRFSLSPTAKYRQNIDGKDFVIVKLDDFVKGKGGMAQFKYVAIAMEDIGEMVVKKDTGFASLMSLYASNRPIKVWLNYKDEKWSVSEK